MIRLHKSLVTIILPVWVVFLLISFSIRECLDLANYQLFISNISSEPVSWWNPIKLFYALISYVHDYLGFNSLSYTELFSALNITIYLFVVSIVLFKFKSPQLNIVFLCLLPLFSSPILVHFFACTFKQAVSLNFLLAAIILWDKDTKSRLLSILLLSLSLLSLSSGLSV